MDLTCTTYKNKTVTLKKTENALYMDNTELKDVKKMYFFPCSLTTGDAHLVIQFGSAPKGDGKTVYFFRRNWLNKPITTSDDDDAVVKELNHAICETYSGLGYDDQSFDQSTGFEGRVDKTFEMSKIYDGGDVLVGPHAKLFMEKKNIDAVFLERLTSYTRTFDVTIIRGDSKLGISTVQRKKHFNYVKETFKDNGCYETGPDPLPWNDMFKRKQQDNLTWKELHKIISEVDEESEDDSSEWEEGQTEEEEDEEDEEYDYPDEDEIDPDELKEGIYVSESDSDDDYVNVLDDEDYDAYNDKKRPLEEDEVYTSNKKTKV
jgi:hypothetical protein